jgi:hypothetical protein
MAKPTIFVLLMVFLSVLDALDFPRSTHATTCMHPIAARVPEAAVAKTPDVDVDRRPVQPVRHSRQLDHPAIT